MNLIVDTNSLYLVAEGIASGTTCFVWENNDCHWKRTIRIKNCGQYFVYQLPRPPAVFSRYCTTKYGIGSKQTINHHHTCHPLCSYVIKIITVICSIYDIIKS